tara:strand:+ start:9354 stop:11033 length:1680 start_codon:yes stop_codon:yes gene_type:complete
MLLNLEIKNFILIDHHKIDFKSGFSTITGETGAGKSIILDAINLLRGDRLDSSVQKTKDKKTEIIGEFNISRNNKIKTILKENELIDEEDNDILNIRRTISANGKSSAYVNGIKSSLKILKIISEYLIEINSQNSNRNILNNDYQMSIIDLYSNNKENLKELKLLFENFKDKEKLLEKFKKEKQEQESKKELLLYKLDELEELNIQENEYLELEEKQKKLSSSEDLKKTCNNILSFFDDYNLDRISNELEDLIENDNVNETKKMLNEAIINIEEVKNNIKKEESSIYYDEEELNEINERIHNINIISKKHLIDPENIDVYIKDIRNEFDKFEEFDQEIINIEKDIEDIYNKWLLLANKISENRKSITEDFSNQVTNKIKLLKMDNATFKVKINKKENQDINKNGIDIIEFLISTNLGSPFELIHKAASGGEISRITLAIKSIISKNETIPIRIFDEVDSGIGGTTGNSIGLFLYEISKFSQVFTITHLAQVAAFSDNQFFVFKKDENNITKTFINNIEGEDRLKEISRMMGYENFNEDNKKMVLNLIENSKNKLRGHNE